MPTTPSAGPSRFTTCSTSSAAASVSDGAGRTQAESPECTPASSTCCMTAPMYRPRRRRARRRRARSRSRRSGRAGRCLDRGHRRLELVLVVADAHRAAAEHVGRAHEHRIADLLDGVERLGEVGHDRPRRAADAELLGEEAEALAILGEVDRLVRRAEDAVAALLDGAREPKRRLTAELGDDADRLLAIADREHLLGRERLEVEAVGGVVVGRDGLGVAVDHHRLVAERAEGLRGVHAAVVELDPLADAVRARAEDDDARLVARRRGLVGLAPGRVEVVRGASTSPAQESTRR